MHTLYFITNIQFLIQIVIHNYITFITIHPSIHVKIKIGIHNYIAN
jgi:hypothetical protein